MKNFLITSLSVMLIILGIYYLYYYQGVNINIGKDPKTVSTFVKTQGKKIYLKKGNQFEEFEIRGVDLGASIPGHFATDFAIKKDDYLRWFEYIQDMGANCIRVYTILHDDFYDAFYEYNKDKEIPLYLINGIWVDDYIQNSRRDAFDPKFMDKFIKDGKILIDIIHGQRKLSFSGDVGNGSYNKDISPWVLGYIAGIEWIESTVAYTDHLQNNRNSYIGTYMKTTENASAFEAMLAQVGDTMISYETQRYKSQRLLAFSNWPTTDPFTYSEEVAFQFKKYASVDVEHIKTTDKYISGTFASYHIYPYFPDYLQYQDEIPILVDEDGNNNTYKTYLKQIADHHSIPVIISEYGIPTSRGIACYDVNTHRSQGYISEFSQGEMLVKTYNDIMKSGCSGSILFSWQDEWFKRTWNTMHSVDLSRTPYWSDAQTNEQAFGLLTFDPGKEKSICYVDGNMSDWAEDKTPIITNSEGIKLYGKYDEKYVYFLVKGSKINENTNLTIPIDITDKSGSTYCQNYDKTFQRPADFVIRIDSKTNSKIQVQKRYNVLRAAYSQMVYSEDAYVSPPEIDSPIFEDIHLMLQTSSKLKEYLKRPESSPPVETFETGLLTYGNGNPNHSDFNSLADFCYGDGFLEIRLPWQILNFADPSRMKIHDDYYLNYGVQYININSLHIGVSQDDSSNLSIDMAPLKLKGWGQNPNYHERLKKSYYIIKKAWAGKDD